MYSEESMYSEKECGITSALKHLTNIKAYKKLSFFNPCRKCLVKAACSQSCYEKSKFDKGKDIKAALIVGMSTVATVALLVIISMMLFITEHKVGSVGFTVFWIAFFIHFWILVGDS